VEGVEAQLLTPAVGWFMAGGKWRQGECVRHRGYRRQVFWALFSYLKINSK
jgi:hypothetical protein